MNHEFIYHHLVQELFWEFLPNQSLLKISTYVGPLALWPCSQLIQLGHAFRMKLKWCTRCRNPAGNVSLLEFKNVIATSDVLVPVFVLEFLCSFHINIWKLVCFLYRHSWMYHKFTVADLGIPLEHTHRVYYNYNSDNFCCPPFSSYYIGNVHSHVLGTANANVSLVVWTGTSSHMLCKVGTNRGFTGYWDDESLERYHAWNYSGNNIDTHTKFVWLIVFLEKERDLATRKGSDLGLYWDDRFEIIKQSAHPTWISC